ncbi:3-dehydroquinate synthase [Aliikangiella marina]|uniref:3-dehydroquinate synthase n=1 Tax=Aliikangiella marina TaxID=1712262 RepID=A0A545TBM6_9GAMM|nr:3-dehydroquinate synthase [Aliikangiella marina]TQV74628.1 3-dehydroquinate synthase [Aliikangiella marina]
MRTLELDLAERSYNIYINEGLLTNRDLLSQYCRGDKVLILSNQTVAPIYLAMLSESLKHLKVYSLALPDGEIYKNLESYQKVLDFLIENQFRRNDTLITLGGGVIGDLGGFVAASYQRGMGFIQVPTSLLAQVDSSVGGKTGVNHPLGKNMIGAFYQPKAVIIDTATLDTLPDREYYSGFAEVLKYAMLGSKEILSSLQDDISAILARDKNVLSDIVYYSCLMKAEVVAADEREQGQRALLNLGHTFGHAVEKVTEYKQYLHGEAVAIGIAMALNLSADRGLVSEERRALYLQLIEKLKLPSKTSLPLSVDELINAMRLDKKNLSDSFRLVLPKDNHCIISEEKDSKPVALAISKQLD